MEQVAQKFVTIRWAGADHLIPSNMWNDIKKTIGSKRAKNGRDILMGLDRDERIAILPALIGVDSTSQQWESKVREFYADLAIHVGEEGERLNITTRPEKKNINGRLVEIQMPEVPLDYVKYKQCLVDKSVAENAEEAKSGTYGYYIEDLEDAKKREKLAFKSQQKLEQDFIRLTQINEDDDTYINEQEIKFVALVMGRNIQFHDVDDLVLEIKGLKERSLIELKDGVNYEDTSFVKVVKDPKLKDKAFIITLVDKGILNKQGEYYVDANQEELVLGDTLDKAVSFIRDPNNSNRVLSYKEKLKQVKQVA